MIVDFKLSIHHFISFINNHSNHINQQSHKQHNNTTIRKNHIIIIEHYYPIIPSNSNSIDSTHHSTPGSFRITVPFLFILLRHRLNILSASAKNRLLLRTPHPHRSRSPPVLEGARGGAVS
eukprot:GHVU01021294.1.p1 GENE.GHVU01021294.1~~GHVU01021294.1.p1  ORF type:complete len:121 (+),score=12.09 GHVU01021294.1:8-370(+)